MSSPCLKSLIAHRIKYRLLTRSTRPSMTLFWTVSPSSCLILYLVHFILAIIALLQFLPHPLFFFNSPDLLFLPPGPLHLLLPSPGFSSPAFHITSRYQLRLFLIFYQKFQQSPCILYAISFIFLMVTIT